MQKRDLRTMISLKSVYRTQTCGELRSAQVGQKVILSGWIARMRDHGGVVFIDLRDHYGTTQVVFAGSARTVIQDLRVESVIKVEGEVRARSTQLVNPKIETGEIEVHSNSFELLSAAEVLPFQVVED